MAFSEKILAKLQGLPDKPGVYFMRDRNGRIIYVGKALSLRKRVRSYFRASTGHRGDPKLRSLIHSIDDFEYLVVRSEAEALLTEGRLIKEYRPRYNSFFKDDKRFLLLKVHLNDPFPRFEAARIEKPDGARYFGPYANSAAAWAALDFMERRFGLRPCRPREPGPEDHRHCHNDIVRFCTAPCIGRISAADYLARVEEACAFLRGDRPDVLKDLRTEMEKAAAGLDFEKAAALRDTLLLLQRALKEKAKGLRNLEVRAEDARQGLVELQAALGLAGPPRVIECFDNSNISGTHAVSSMVCAVDGIPDRRRYRRFRIRTVTGIDDPAMMREVVFRRYRRLLDEKKPLPDLVLVDGGVTQLSAARAALTELGLTTIPTAGLAKCYEEVHANTAPGSFPLRLPRDSRALHVLQRLRDEAHRFAITYHRALRARKARESLLDEVEGLGEKRKQELLRFFGSVRRMQRATEDELAAAPGVGPVMARAIHAVLHRTKGKDEE